MMSWIQSVFSYARVYQLLTVAVSSCLGIFQTSRIPTCPDTKAASSFVLILAVLGNIGDPVLE